MRKIEILSRSDIEEIVRQSAVGIVQVELDRRLSHLTADRRNQMFVREKEEYSRLAAAIGTKPVPDSTPIKDLKFPPSVTNCLAKAGILNLSQLAWRIDMELLAIPNLGKKKLHYIKLGLARNGRVLGDRPRPL